MPGGGGDNTHKNLSWKRTGKEQGKWVANAGFELKTTTTKGPDGGTTYSAVRKKKSVARAAPKVSSQAKTEFTGRKSNATYTADATPSKQAGSTILTGGQGLLGDAPKKRKTLLGG
tara:strand:+ start:119 stop:466 length:348 start_codon:yes stop_codon:yes gene_type:complete